MTIPERAFDFKAVEEGATVEHAFQVLNKGDKVLQITKVKTSIGCTVARFDRSIPPGGEGSITLQLNLEGYHGTNGTMSKRAVVYSNDPKQPRVTLTVYVRVKVTISLEPRGVFLKGSTNDDITGVVTIRAHKDQPLILEPVKLSLAGRIEYVLKTIEKGRVYHAVFRNISKKERKYNGFLTLKTNYPEKPEISIRFVGHIENKLP